MSIDIGSQRLTADGVVGTSAKPYWIYTVIVRSNATGAAVVNLRNGDEVTDTIFDVINVSAADTTVVRTYAGGLYCPDGCFVDVDANTSFVVVGFRRAF